jgi:carboxymethylenebutenolidase
MGHGNIVRLALGLVAVAGLAACSTTLPTQSALTGQEIVLGTPLGTTFDGYVSGPEAARRAVLLINEYWGFNRELREEADRYAAQGYRALAIDVFDGRASTDPDTADLIVSQVDQVAVDVDLKAAVDYLSHPGRQVITLGWGYGGAQALRAAEVAPEEVDATVMYYGLPITDDSTATSRQPIDPAVLLKHTDYATDVPELETVRGPVLAIFAKHDPWITEQDVEDFTAAMRQARAGLWLVRLEAKRGFYDPLSKGYDPAAADAARRYTQQFLTRELGGTS